MIFVVIFANHSWLMPMQMWQFNSIVTPYNAVTKSENAVKVKTIVY
jgi:hypothetical protein